MIYPYRNITIYEIRYTAFTTYPHSPFRSFPTEKEPFSERLFQLLNRRGWHRSINRLCVGQHLLDVFVCHVESYARIYVMFGEDYLRATGLFQVMNTCPDLMHPRDITSGSVPPFHSRLLCLDVENKSVGRMKNKCHVSCAREDLSSGPRENSYLPLSWPTSEGTSAPDWNRRLGSRSLNSCGTKSMR